LSCRSNSIRLVSSVVSDGSQWWFLCIVWFQLRGNGPSIILNLLRGLNSMIDYQLGACWNLSPEIWTETIVVCYHILRMLFSCSNNRRHIIVWVISYVFHYCHLIYSPVIILRLLCGMLMIRYRMRIWS
jgi:hypothetical protein